MPTNEEADHDHEGAETMESRHGSFVLFAPPREIKALLKEKMRPHLVEAVLQTDTSKHGPVSSVHAFTVSCLPKPFCWGRSPPCVPLGNDPQKAYLKYMLSAKREFAFFSVEDPHLSRLQKAILISFAFPRPGLMVKLVSEDRSLLSARLPGCNLTLLETAARRGNLKLARVIFDADPVLALSNSFPLHWLAYANNIPGIEIFMKLGYSLESKAPASSSVGKKVEKIWFLHS